MIKSFARQSTPTEKKDLFPSVRATRTWNFPSQKGLKEVTFKGIRITISPARKFHLGQETVRHLLPVSPGGNLRRDNSSSSSPSPHLGCFPNNSGDQGGKILTAQESQCLVPLQRSYLPRSVEVAQASDDSTGTFDQSLGVHILVHHPLVL